jgi:hypothetical protein
VTQNPPWKHSENLRKLEPCNRQLKNKTSCTRSNKNTDSSIRNQADELESEAKQEEQHEGQTFLSENKDRDEINKKLEQEPNPASGWQRCSYENGDQNACVPLKNKVQRTDHGNEKSDRNWPGSGWKSQDQTPAPGLLKMKTDRRKWGPERARPRRAASETKTEHRTKIDGGKRGPRAKNLNGISDMVGHGKNEN